VVTAKLMNVKKGAVESRAEFSKSNTTDLRRAAKNVGRRLFGVADIAAPANLASSSSSSPSTSEPGAPINVALWSGVGVGAIGVIGAGVAGTMALLADARLADPKTSS